MNTFTKALAILISLMVVLSCNKEKGPNLKEAFMNPPDSVRPGVYWYFMDGNLSRDEITADLESMAAAGIGMVVFLEVNVGVPRGPVDFLSDEWQDIFRHTVREAERLGIEITLGSGPGWAGSGGPWVKPEQSMRHLVAASVLVNGPGSFEKNLPIPVPRTPYFGERTLTENLKTQWDQYYQDVAVLAFPSNEIDDKIEDIDEKALYYRAPYSSTQGVKPFLPAPSTFPDVSMGSVISNDSIIDLTDRLQQDGTLDWDVPPGNWTVMRFGLRNNGAVTRPAPMPGLGFECDKFDTTAFNEHFDAYIGKLLAKVGPRENASGGGWTMLHIDSWEMGAQNWSDQFRDEFIRRRGYDPLPFIPTYTGLIVGSLEVSERFLWDMRLSGQELVLENHAGHFKRLGRRYGFGLSIEPYDMNPTADLDLGAVADVPMCEFWSKGYGFNTAYSCIESSSIAHIHGRPVVAAEAFTAGSREAWKLYPGAVKNQGDWAFCMGINRFVYHTFAHKYLGEEFRPGMTMGPYGVHWDRGQTWWPMAAAYHKYIARCQFLLQQGRTVADILYLAPEGAPHVFRPPSSAMTGEDIMPDRREYNFDGCSPNSLIDLATVRDHKIVFPSGAAYNLLVLPALNTMTPELLEKIGSLVQEGATVVGSPPVKSPSLVNYPECDERVKEMAGEMWGDLETKDSMMELHYGEGRIIYGGAFARIADGELYPDYNVTADLLKQKGVSGDFISSGPIRYTHRQATNKDIYFVSNRSDQTVKALCAFRNTSSDPELWDPMTGDTRQLPESVQDEGRITIPLIFQPSESYFIVFDGGKGSGRAKATGGKNFDSDQSIMDIPGPWSVSFDPEWGGPEEITFDQLVDWTNRPEEGIKYYSGVASYSKSFDLPTGSAPDDFTSIFLDLGKVNHLARIWLNGMDMGVVWTAPWRVDVTDVVEEHGNQLKIEVVNLWINRLIGDEMMPEDGIMDGRWPDWLVEGRERSSGRYTFTTHRYYKKDAPLHPSGLLGPVVLLGRRK